MPSNSPTRDPLPSGDSGVLYVVATPIGNLEDITLRALSVLSRVDLVAAEDTRHTGRLLAFHKIKRALISCHEHNESERAPELIARLKAGDCVALVSNAGTPSVSDPGFRLVRAAIAEGIKVVPIPGVSAAVTALSVAGLPTDAFVFVGFPASKKNRRLKQLQELANASGTLVFYESPRRLLAFLEEVEAAMGDRNGVVCREMTKLHEEFVRGRLSEIRRRLASRPAVKGECTVLVTGRTENREILPETLDSEIKKGLESDGRSLSDLTRALAKKYGLPKNRVYEHALKIKGAKKEAQGDT